MKRLQVRLLSRCVRALICLTVILRPVAGESNAFSELPAELPMPRGHAVSSLATSPPIAVPAAAPLRCRGVGAGQKRRRDTLGDGGLPRAAPLPSARPPDTASSLAASLPIAMPPGANQLQPMLLPTALPPNALRSSTRAPPSGRRGSVSPRGEVLHSPCWTAAPHAKACWWAVSWPAGSWWASLDVSGRNHL